MLFGIGTKAEFINPVNHLAQVIAALDTVFQLAEDLANLVLDGGGALRRGLESFQVGKKLTVNKILEVIAGRRPVMVNLAISGFWRCPRLPAGPRTQQRDVWFAGELRSNLLLLFKIVKVLEKEYPRGLLNVVELTAAACVFVEDIVNILECLLKQWALSLVVADGECGYTPIALTTGNSL